MKSSDIKFDLEEALQLLGHTPDVLTAFLSHAPETWLYANEGEDTWSPFDILGHLVHGERTDWINRTRMILEDGESKTFEPFDRFAQFRDSEGKTVAMLLSEFEGLREENLRYLNDRQLTAADLDRTGRHPEFGRVTLRQLLSTWVVHDLSHIRQIARVMAKQYRDEIGPWEKFLRVVNE